MTGRFLFLLLIIVTGYFIPVKIAAQQRRFENISSKQGLSQNTVNCILQDSEGLLWFGTQNGLNCWDGYNFKIYRFNRNDTNSIPDNFILSLVENTGGFIAVGTRNGFACFDKQSGVFTRAATERGQNNPLHETVLHIMAGTQNRFYFSQNKKIWIYDPATRTTSHSKISWEKELRTFIRDEKTKQAYALLTQGLFRIDPDHSAKTLLCPLAENRKATYAAVSGKTIYLAEEKLLRCVDTENGSGAARICSTLPAYPTCVAAAADGNLWIGTMNGLYVFHPATGELEYLAVTPNKPNGLSSNRIVSLYAGKDELVWIGNTENGADVCDISAAARSVRVFYTNGLSNQVLWSTVAVRNGWLFGTTSGVQFMSENKAPAPDWLRVIPADVFAASMCFDTRGRLWIATRNRGIIQVDTLTRKLTGFIVAGSALLPNTAYHVRCDRDGTMWFATSSGLCYCEAGANRLRYQTVYYTKKDTLDYITSTFEDSKGRLWVGSNRGVSVSDVTKKTFRQYGYEPGNPESISHPLVSWVAEDKQGVIWLGTFGGGLNRFDAATGGFSVYGTAAGLPDEVIYVVAPDKQNRLWLTTDRGLVCFDPEGQKSFTYTMKDGLTTNEFVQNGFYNAGNDQFYFSNASSCVHVDAGSTGWPVFTGRPAITGLHVNNTEHARSDSLLLLRPDERDIAVSFATVSYRYQEKISYSYKLDGYDTAWIEPPAGIRYASYTNLPYGDYTLRIRCRISGGDWSPNERTMTLRISTPFWRTTWFLVLLGIAVIGLIATGVWIIAGIRHRKRMRAAEVERKIHLERERISRDLHDHLGAQISYFISTADFIAYGLEQHTSEQSRKLLQELSNGGRTTMQELRETIWALNKASYTASEFAERLRTYFSQHLASDTLQWKLAIDGNTDTVLQPALLLNTFRIIQEALSNVKKHADAKLFTIEMRVTEKEFIVTISDDGIGFDLKSSPEGHYGLDNMQLRATETGGTLDVNSEKGKGTKLVFTAPLTE